MQQGPPEYNYRLGILRYLHPFDGVKFETIYTEICKKSNVDLISPPSQVSMEIIDEYVNEVMHYRIRNKNGICNALEIPKIPLVNFSFLNKKILIPMRWGVAGTILGATKALENNDIYWNLSGGYHHAMQQNMEGFCIYNDIGITYQQLIKKGLLTSDDKILIIDTDAHHGNGNAYSFIDNSKVTILDVYNSSVYPQDNYSRSRVDIPVPLMPGTQGKDYLEKYGQALDKLDSDYKIAFVVAGTDTLSVDKLGRLNLEIDDIAEREKMTLTALKNRGIPAVILGGGGYSKDSAKSVIKAIETCVEAGF
ncbi:MAG TPA: histone deacetylase [Gammaproteobacteria bacterium]|nr:histone deacetylase [Gammaproteobacteria bacterium]